MSRAPVRRASVRDRGFAAVELVTGVALLVLPVALLVGSLPEWGARQSLGRAAAREVARTVARSGVCDAAAAAAVATEARAAAGLPAGDLTAGVDCAPAAPLPRSGSVTARVTVAMPALQVPFLGGVAAWTWTAVHREPVDPYGSRP